MLIKSAKTLAQTVWFSQLKNDKSGLFLNWNKVLKIVVAYRWLYDEIKVFITKLALFSTTKDSKAVLCGGTPTTIISCNCKFILFLKFSCNKVCQSKTFMNRKFNFDVSKKIINDHIIFDISFNFNYYIIWYFAENFRNWKLSLNKSISNFNKKVIKLIEFHCPTANGYILFFTFILILRYFLITMFYFVLKRSIFIITLCLADIIKSLIISF